MNDLGTYSIKEFSIVRQILSEAYEITQKTASVVGLIELNITKARNAIREIEHKTGTKLSFTGWLIKCIAQAVSEHKQVHAYRFKKSKLIVFDNVHVRTMVERFTETGKPIPISHVVKFANIKSVVEITNEIREVQQRKVVEKNQFVEGTPSHYLKLFKLLPKCIRKMIIRQKATNPYFFIENSGTVGITSVGLFSKNMTGWAIPFTASTLDIAVGGIKSRPAIVDGNLTEHEFLCLTLVFDHNVVDGGPATRFIARFGELIESGFGLDENIQ